MQGGELLLDIGAVARRLDRLLCGRLGAENLGQLLLH